MYIAVLSLRALQIKFSNTVTVPPKTSRKRSLPLEADTRTHEFSDLLPIIFLAVKKSQTGFKISLEPVCADLPRSPRG